jgi:hypothetical protein
MLAQPYPLHAKGLRLITARVRVTDLRAYVPLVLLETT